MPPFLLRGATVIDGTGAAAFQANVAVEGDRIAAVGPSVHLAHAQVVEANGLVVAPGFIDVHNHSDGWMLKSPHLVSKTTQGFTTEVLMSDGISYAPVDARTAPEWIYYLRSLDALEQTDYRGWHSIGDYMSLLHGRNVQNSVAQIPYANLRVQAMGWRRGPADDTQLRRMQQMVRRAMDDGAVALSTGLDYVAQCFASTDEIAAVAGALPPYGGLYVTHVRYKLGALAGLREAVEISRRAGVPLHVSHLKGGDPREADQLLDYIDRVAVHEVDFSFDVYPYLPGSTMLHSLLPYEAWEQGPLGVPRRLASPRLRRRFAEQLDDYRLGLDAIRLAWLPGAANRRYLGMSLADYARQIGRPTAEAICDLLIDEGLAVLCVFFSGDDALVEPFLRHPRCVLASDGIWFSDGRIHPRQYGSAPRLLGPLVRDRRLLTLEEAVRKLSGFPAQRFGLAHRGLVREGYFADLVVFDPHRIRDRATFDEPHQLSDGVVHLYVNGIPVIVEGKPHEPLPHPLPGRVLVKGPGFG
jgi:N-acyl-D-amino-acid deacylase